MSYKEINICLGCPKVSVKRQWRYMASCFSFKYIIVSYKQHNENLEN